MNGKVYYFHVGGKTYNEAVAYCLTKEGMLAEPKSLQEHNDMATLAETVTFEGLGVWIGINDKSQEGSFTYESDGEFIEYTNWYPGKPDSSGDCVILKKSNGFKWNDHPCRQNMSFICEKDEESGNF